MSYPYFNCVVCGGRVQKAVFCVPGSLPLVSYLDRDACFSSSFDDESEYVRHCRGQGSQYSIRRVSPLFYGNDGEVLHFQFSGCFAGMCCFCALYAGLNVEAFSLNGCRNCTLKEELRAEFAKLARRSDEDDSDQSVALTWASHGWGALPSALVDYILVFAMGMDGCSRETVIRDGEVLSGRT